MSKETHKRLIIYSPNWVFTNEWPTSHSFRQAEKLGVILDISFLPLSLPPSLNGFISKVLKVVHFFLFPPITLFYATIIFQLNY